ncbi:MAG TPA: hypothetical protein VJU59_02735 [Paraburkholderia sp.]|nr:hypothetical protein [Paraburkholderia sp.]
MTVAVAVVAVTWDLIDEKPFISCWWVKLSVTPGIGLNDLMLWARTEA